MLKNRLTTFIFNAGDEMKEQIECFINDMGIDNLEDISSLFKDYISESSSLMEQIKEIIDLSPINTGALEKLVHNLKGVSANLYVKNVYYYSSLLDDYLKRTTDSFPISNEFNILWEQLSDSYKKTIPQIKQYFCENGYDITQ